MGVELFVYLAVAILMIPVRGIVAAKTEAAGEKCRITRCSRHGPEIRFPFWVKDRQPEHCGHPGFRISCDKRNTILEFQYAVNTSLQGTSLLVSKGVPVRSINYTSQEIAAGYSDTFPNFTPNLTLVSTSMLPTYALYNATIYYHYIENFTFLSCPSTVQSRESTFVNISLHGQAFPVYYFQGIPTSEPSITSCTKVFHSTLPYYLLRGFELGAMTWSTPNSSNIETADNKSRGIFIITLIGLQILLL